MSLSRLAGTLLVPSLVAACGGRLTAEVHITQLDAGGTTAGDAMATSTAAAVDASFGEGAGSDTSGREEGSGPSAEASLDTPGETPEAGTTTVDVAGDASGEEGLDADGACTAGTVRCAAQTPQTCDSTGRWTGATACVATKTHCFNGRCEVVPQSCAQVARATNFDCGGGTTDDCCAAYDVPGGTFLRDYDGVSWVDRSHPATVSAFRLDAYEITVGRFRQFVTAVVRGWTPGPGSGKHTNLNQGQGLAARGDAGASFESGWQAAWTSQLPTTAAAWDAHLECDPNLATWTPMQGSNELRPVNCIDWYDAYAFCIWDVTQEGAGGFLPTSAEWNYAASGGSEQRVYAWGNQAPAADATLAIWGDYYGGSLAGPSVYKIAPVGSAPAGDGKWGQSDLTGNLFEWNLDMSPAQDVPCVDCVDTLALEVDGGGMGAILRGGAFESIASELTVSSFDSSLREVSQAEVGARCARAP